MSALTSNPSVLIRASRLRPLLALLAVASPALPFAPASSAPVSLSVQEKAPARATRILGVTALVGGQIGYRVETDGTPRRRSVLLDKPDRIVIDFPDVQIARTVVLPSGAGLVKGIRLRQFSVGEPKVARLVLDLAGKSPYQILTDDTGLSIVLGEPPPASPSKGIAQVKAPAPAVAPAAVRQAPMVPPNATPSVSQPLVPANVVAPAQTEASAPATEGVAQATVRSDPSQIDLKRPTKSGEDLSYELPPIDPSRVPPPEPDLPRESLGIPDRWRILETLGMVKQKFKDPYNQNVYKGDKPYIPFKKWGDDVFLNLVGISESLVEGRRLPIPVGAQSSRRAGALDVFAPSNQLTVAQSIIFGASIIKGNTTFKPPDYEYRLILAANLNRSQVDPVRALTVDPGRGFVRYDNHIAVVEAFYDKHRRNVSERYDFDSLRVGIQPITSDFRGFLFQDNALGLRYFGNRDNNRTQYNLAALVRMEKDTNTGLIEIRQRPRSDFVLLANIYKQDFPRPGHTTQLTVINNLNLEDGPDYYNQNGFQERPAVLGDARPHRYNVTYLGANGDGHFGKWNLTTSLYGALGHDSRNPLAQRPQTIAAAFAAAELSRDFDWIRGRFTVVGATGDSDPFDGKSTGFDAIMENPQIAGADTGFWIRQAVPLAGGGGVALSGRNGILPSLRSSKDQGQSNFVNPGLLFVGLGADVDLTPQVRVVTNVSAISFANTAVLSVLRNQGPLDRFVGIDTSAAVQFRPLMTQNIVLNLSAAALLPGRSFKQLFDENRRGPQYSILLNMLFSY